MTITRRDFAVALTGTAATLQAATPRNQKIGHTCITWGTFSRNADSIATLEPAVRDIAALGYHGFETFPEILEDWDKRGALKPLLEKYKLPVTSGYIRINVTDPTKRQESLDSVIRLGKVLKKFGANFAPIAVNSVDRKTYDFKLHRDAIVAGLNDSASALADLGLGGGLHQHTGTAVDTRDEVYYVMEKCNTKVMKFAPDAGQLQKSGADAAKVIKDFLSITKHVHLKDYKGWDHFVGYCPLGMGQVDVAGILDSLEDAKQQANIMVELDPSNNAPMTPLDTAKTTKDYLFKLGYKFRA